MTNRITINEEYSQYPTSPPYNPFCPINTVYKTLPSDQAGSCVGYVNTAIGPSSVKSLYTGIPNFYPNQRTRYPVNTLYGLDLSQFAQNGKRLSYHYKVWPLTHRHVRETREYDIGPVLPYMDNREWTRYPVETDTNLGGWY